MAVAARPPAAGGPAGLKIALVVFVCLTVASLAFAIVLYTGQEELTQSSEAARKNAQTAGQREQEARAALQELAFRVLAKRIDDPVEINATLETVAAAIFGKDPTKITDLAKQIIADAGIKRNDPLLTTLQALHQALTRQTEKLQAAEIDVKNLGDELAARTADLKRTQDQFATDADALKNRVAELEQQVAANQGAWQQNVAKLRQQAEAEEERASDQLASERKQRQVLEQQLAQNRTRINELVATLATFRPSAETTSLLEIADGYVVQTVWEQRIVYVNLGRKDHIKPGMTFAVYSKIRGIPADGKGKATIRVTNVFETTSECAVHTSTAADPIVDGDVIANPVYDRNRLFNFFVAGDFDLDFDGKIDDPDGEQIRRMIQDWGGKLQPAVDTLTDFVVLGAAPVASSGETAAEARRKFDAAKQEARTLGIPVLTRSQFLHFVGFGVPRNAKDD